MPNNNTIARARGAGQDAGQGASSTAEFQFEDNESTPVRLRLRIPPLQVKDRPFMVKAGGRVTGGTTTNFTVNLDSGDSATIGTNTTIETHIGAVNTESGSWYIEAKLRADSTSDKLQGRGWADINNDVVATALTAEVTSVDPDAEIAFTVTGTFSASDAGNFAICDFLECELL